MRRSLRQRRFDPKPKNARRPRPVSCREGALAPALRPILPAFCGTCGLPRQLRSALDSSEISTGSPSPGLAECVAGPAPEEAAARVRPRAISACREGDKACATGVRLRRPAGKNPRAGKETLSSESSAGSLSGRSQCSGSDTDEGPRRPPLVAPRASSRRGSAVPWKVPCLDVRVEGTRPSALCWTAREACGASWFRTEVCPVPSSGEHIVSLPRRRSNARAPHGPRHRFCEKTGQQRFGSPIAQGEQESARGETQASLHPEGSERARETSPRSLTSDRRSERGERRRRERTPRRDGRQW